MGGGFPNFEGAPHLRGPMAMGGLSPLPQTNILDMANSVEKARKPFESYLQKSV